VAALCHLVPPPKLTSITPATGPTSGGDLVKLQGTFAPRVAIQFGDALATVLAVRTEAGLSVAQLRTPAHAEAVVDVTLFNLDAAGNPVAGENAVLAAAYRFQRPRIVVEADLTRLVRTLIRRVPPGRWPWPVRAR
jgi:hypothetical protein